MIVWRGAPNTVQSGRQALQVVPAADALLFAASPDLLAVVRRLVEEWDAFDDEGPMPMDDLISEARRVLAKVQP